MNLLDRFDPIIAERAKLGEFGLRDPFHTLMERVISPTEAVVGGKRIILVGTYNYMGMTFDPDVIEAGVKAMQTFGAGTTGSRVLNGTFAGHNAVEDALRRFYGVDQAIVFSTGYLANVGLCSTLVGQGDYIVIDADSHASIYDGCAMGRADVVRFRHNSAEDLAKRLKRLPPEAGKLVVVEGVYSMLGDKAPLKEIVAAAKEGGAMILVDEAHAMGFFGANGRGVTEEMELEDEVDFIVGTFSKSVGTVGGFAVSRHPKFEALRYACRPYMFTASLPPSVVATARTSIDKLQGLRAKREQLWASSRRMHDGLRALGFSLGTATPESAIIAVVMPDQTAAIRMWQSLLELGVYVNMARPPGTPNNMYLLRCSLCAEHTDAQVGQILDAFARAAKMAELQLAA